MNAGVAPVEGPEEEIFELAFVAGRGVVVKAPVLLAIPRIGVAVANSIKASLSLSSMNKS